MSETKKFLMTIHLNHGEPIRVTAHRTAKEERNMGSRIEENLNSNFLVLSLQNKLTIIPSHNIQLIEIDPAPDVLLSRVVTDIEPV